MRVAVIILASRGSPDAAAVAGEVAAVQTSTHLAESSELVVLPMDNQSLKYAAELRRGFCRAQERGCSHAITLDAGRQHQVVDLPAFFAAMVEHPDAIITGMREKPPGRLPIGVRVARTGSDVWFSVAAGRRIRDGAFGFRAYPLAAADFVAPAGGREVDLDILVTAVWAKAEVVAIPVTIAADSSTQVMTAGEFLGFTKLIWKLLALKLLLPAPMLATIARPENRQRPWRERVWRMITETGAHHGDHAGAFASAVGLGVFFGIAPVWGFQILLGAVTAHLLRLSKTIVVAASTISTPITIPLILYVSLLIGRKLSGGDVHDLPSWRNIHRPDVMRFLGQYLIGSCILAVSAGLSAAVLAYAIARGIRKSATAEPV